MFDDRSPNVGPHTLQSDHLTCLEVADDCRSLIVAKEHMGRRPKRTCNLILYTHLQTARGKMGLVL